MKNGGKMIEKRFTVPENYRCIRDNLTKEHYMCEDKTEAINLAYLLNALYEENKQLKQKIDFYKYFQKDARELEKENEQLKQQLTSILKLTKKIEDYTYDIKLIGDDVDD